MLGVSYKPDTLLFCYYTALTRSHPITHSDLDDDDKSLHYRPRQWASFGGGSSGVNLSMVILLQLWHKWVKDFLGKTTRRIVILDCFMKNRRDFRGDEKPTGISWTNGAMFDSAKSLLGDGMKILQPDCPILLSNFVRKALNDKINLECNDLIAYVTNQDNGDKIRLYITKKQRGSKRKKEGMQGCRHGQQIGIVMMMNQAAWGVRMATF